jgi:hypothetical protein
LNRRGRGWGHGSRRGSRQKSAGMGGRLTNMGVWARRACFTRDDAGT